MKTIEVSDEMYEKLIALATEMTTQDPRCTRMPHMFQIRTKKKRYDWGLNGNHKIWLDDDYNEIETKEEIIEYLNKFDDIDIPEHFDDIWDDEYELKEFLDENLPELRECTYDWEYEYQNHFLTAKACKEHIEQNHYHYSDPVDYLNHAWRNPEMELVSEFLCGLVGKPMHT
jgi:hypothetical protein